MKDIATRELWARQSLLLNWNTNKENDFEYIQAVGRELMRRTKQRARAATKSKGKKNGR